MTCGHSCASLPELFQNSQKTLANDHGLGWEGIHDRMCSMHHSSLLKFTCYQLQQSFKVLCKVFHFQMRGEGLLLLNCTEKEIGLCGEKSGAVSKITSNNTEKCRGLVLYLLW